MRRIHGVKRKRTNFLTMKTIKPQSQGVRSEERSKEREAREKNKLRIYNKENLWT